MLIAMLSAACGSGSSGDVKSQDNAPEKATLTIDPTLPPVAKTPGPVKLSYVPGSSVKVEQIIGEYDRQAKKPTLNLTESKFGVVGTDLGYSFEHNSKL